VQKTVLLLLPKGLIPETIRAEQMKPLFSIITDINIRDRDVFNSFSGESEIGKNTRAFVISSPKTWFLVCLLMMLSLVPAFGTAGVVIVTNEFVGIAADSALKHTDSKGETTGFTQGCKIRKQGSIFYFPIGEYSYPTLGFDLFKIADVAIIKAGKVKNIYPSIEAPVLAHLPAIVQYNKTGSPDAYAKWLKGEKLISIVFASYEDGHPIAAVVEFGIDAQGRIARPTEKTIISVPGQVQWFLSVSSEVAAATDSAAWDRRALSDPVDTSQAVVQLQIDASKKENSYEVGPPVSVLRISRDSSGMVPGHEGECKVNNNQNQN
jgi:hypothetical protein